MNTIQRKAGWLMAGVAALSIGLAPMAFAEPGTLNDTEAAELAFMREEERVARDLYQAFADQYDGARPFSQIVRAEQRHHTIMGTLLTQYGLDDPSAGLPAGQYADPALQALYDGWLADGSVSLEAAYQVGIELEARDIADLDGAIAAAVTDDLRLAFERIQAGSESHLAAFERAASGQLAVGGGQGARVNRGGQGAGAGAGEAAGQGGQAAGQGGQAAGQGMGRGQGGQGQQGQGQGGQGQGLLTGPQDGSGQGNYTGACPYVY